MRTIHCSRLLLRGGGLPQCMLGYTPWAWTPPGPGHPLGLALDTPPGLDTPLWTEWQTGVKTSFAGGKNQKQLRKASIELYPPRVTWVDLLRTGMKTMRCPIQIAQKPMASKIQQANKRVSIGLPNLNIYPCVCWLHSFLVFFLDRDWKRKIFD